MVLIELELKMSCLSGTVKLKSPDLTVLILLKLRLTVSNRLKSLISTGTRFN